MFKRNLVLGGLIAGAFLLPNLAVAGSVTGACVNCHTMHNSQNGTQRFTTMGANLLGGTGCTGCHASTGENDATGKTSGAGLAPQVDNTGSAGFILNGGYFIKDMTATSDALQHNVVGIASVDGALSVAPGGTMNTQLTCSSCHTVSGHHKTSTGKYRMLSGSNATVGQTAPKDYGAAAAPANKIGTRAEVIYQAANMNTFCGSCHATFHTTQGSVGAWTRHPTGVQVTASTTTSITTTRYNSADIDAVVVGSTLATPDNTNVAANTTVMCLSCHVPHGGPYADLLSFNYTANQAGGTTVSTGCETCHSYGGNGM